MALPAGRYGVTKNQLLKIKKLPMNTIKLIEELTEKYDLLGTAAFKNSTSVVTDSTDLVESGAVYTALQAQEQLLEDTVGWLSNNKYDGGDVTLNKSASSSSVTHELDGGFVAGKKYKLRFNISAISGFELATTLRVQIYKTGSTATKILPIYQITQTVGIQVIEFIAESTQTNSTIQLYIQSAETGESATVTFTDISITHISVDEQKADNSVIGTVEDGATASKAWSAGEHFIKDGQFKEVTNPIASGGEINSSNTVNRPIAELLTKLGNLSYKVINTEVSATMVSTGIDTKNQFFAIIILLSNNISQIYCGRRYAGATFFTTDSDNVNIDENGILTVKGNAGSSRYHIIYAQNS